MARAWIVAAAAVAAAFALGTSCAGEEATSSGGAGGEGGDSDWTTSGNVSVSASSTASGGASSSTGTGGAGGGSGGGGTGGAPLDYPPGPYGTTMGTVIADYELVGFPNSVVDTSQLVPIRLADFYNPTGMALYPAGSPYGAGTPKPKALFIDICAAWAGPCLNEASMIFPPKYALYAPQAGEFLEVLWDSPTPNQGATPANLVGWTTKYLIDYPAAIDPPHMFLGNMLTAYPTTLIVDPRTMTIVAVVLGAPDDSFWTKYESILAL